MFDDSLAPATRATASFAPAKRALIFFGCMGTLVAGLTFGADLQIPADQSSTTVAMARGEDSAVRIASVNRSDRTESAAKRAIPSPSKQAMADSPNRIVYR